MRDEYRDGAEGGWWARDGRHAVSPVGGLPGEVGRLIRGIGEFPAVLGVALGKAVWEVQLVTTHGISRARYCSSMLESREGKRAGADGI